MTGIPKGTLLLAQTPLDEAISWITHQAGMASWLKRARDLEYRYTASGRGSMLQRHHVEICIAAGLYELASGGDLSALLQQPFLDAFVFAGLAKEVHSHLSPAAQKRHRGKIKQAIRNEYGFGALRTEYTAITMGLDIGCDVILADYEGVANYDLLFADEEEELELECKLLTHEFGAFLRPSHCRRLSHALEKLERGSILRPGASRIVWLTVREKLPQKDEGLRVLASIIASAAADRQYERPDYVEELRVEDWPLGAVEPDRAHSEARFITVMRGWNTFALCDDNCAFILALRSVAERELDRSEMLTRRFRNATDQFSGKRPGVIFAEVEGPTFDLPLILTMKDEMEEALDGVFKGRPFLEFVILGFPGPPFTAGATYAVRNPRVKRRNLSFISRRLERHAWTEMSSTIPYKEFRKEWWQPMYRWEHKTVEDLEKVLESIRHEAIRRGL